MLSGNDERKIQHYSSSQKILLVGEGDFSFSSSLASAFGSASNMVATSLDTRGTLLTKYLFCGRTLEKLEDKGCLLLHEVDVHYMNLHSALMHMKFDVIVFNFPHAGHFPGIFRENSVHLIEMHRVLLRGFFGSASEMLEEGGEVHVAHRDDYPYNQWKVEELASEQGFVLKEKVEFNKWDYPGYTNKRGGDVNADGEFILKQSYTFKFSLNLFI